MKNVLTMRKDKVMKQYTKYICVFLMMVGISTSVWGTSSSFDVSSITLNSVDWGTSTTSLEKYVGYNNGSVVTANNSSVWFEFTIGDEFDQDYLYAFIADHTDGLGLTIDGIDPISGYVCYVKDKSQGGDYEVGDGVAITLHYVITEPRTSHTATLKFCRYDYDDPSADEYGWVAVLSVPVTINMTGGYVISTAVDPSATGSMTAKVNGSARTRVMSNERLDLVATPADGYQFLGWTTDGDEDTDWEIDNDMSASTYAYIHANQTITANFEVACTSHTISLTNSGTGTNGTFSADKSSACEDATITLTATPSSGYELDEWTVSKAGGGTCTVDGSNQFSMPSVNVTVNATFKAATYSLSFNANGGSGSMDAVDRVYNSTAAIPANTFIAPTGKVFDGWATSLGGDKVYNPGANYTMGAGDATLYAHWRNGILSDYKFSCADWSLTGPSGDTVFITSTASKTVRSQEAFHVTASGLPASTALTFTTFPANTRYAFKKADGSAVSTDTYGKVNTDFYVFYTPTADDSSDGLDEITTLYVSVTGEPRKDTLDTKTIIGRHLPTNFVIAAKKNGKWWALPSDMTTSTPSPVEIAVDNATNPGIAYTATTNIYSIAQPAASEYIRLKMNGQSNYPLFGSASTAPIGKSSQSNPDAADILDGYLWKLVQKRATGLSNPQEAKYLIYCKNNSSNHLRLKATDQWGLYDSGIDELRLIPASNIVPTEAYFVEWSQHGGVVEVDAQGVDATSVVAHLGEETSSAITLVETKASDAKNKSSKYNYTVNFGGSIDFAAATSNGAMLTLEWKNGETTKAMSNIIVPKIIASSATMKSIMSGDNDWKTEVHVLPGVTLIANAGDFESNDVLINQLEIYPGATVVVTKGLAASGTLKVKTLVLRNGWTRAGEKAYDVARLYITPTTASLAKNASDDVWYTDWYIDYDQYYPIAVPWDVTLANISYRYASIDATVGHDQNIRLRYYNGASRAANGQTGVGAGANWKLYGAGGAESVPTKLEPSKGYALTAKRPSGKAFSILRMPLTIPSADWTTGGEKGYVESTHKDQVSVTGWGKGTAEWYAMGWNFIGNPYMCTFNGDDSGISGKLELQNGGSIRYATIPDVDFKNYDQVAIADADLKPASGFFVQANDAEAKTITFNASKIVDPTAAPARYTTQTEAIPEQEAYIRLSYAGGRDQMGIIIGDDYTEAYEVNADLAKVPSEGNFLKTYMNYQSMDMAYVAINQMLAQQWIPVSVIIPESGEYTYSLTQSSEVDQLEGIYLIDYENGGQMTNLIYNNYTFTAEAGTIQNRFAINAIVGQRETPTAVDIVGGAGLGDEPVKFIYHDKVFILHQGVIYDATGKRVRRINK